MIFDESIFVTKRRISSIVIIANDEALKARAIGDVQVDLRRRFITMRNVLLMFDLNANLFSISTLNRKGFTVLFIKDGVEIKREDILIATKIVRRRMYLLRTVVTAFYIIEGKETSIFENSMRIIISEAIDVSKKSKKIPSIINQKTNAFKL